jgi:hypothetical protein
MIDMSKHSADSLASFAETFLASEEWKSHNARTLPERKGCSAALRGGDFDENPYSYASAAWDQWYYGFLLGLDALAEYEFRASSFLPESDDLIPLDESYYTGLSDDVNPLDCDDDE